MLRAACVLVWTFSIVGSVATAARAQSDDAGTPLPIEAETAPSVDTPSIEATPAPTLESARALYFAADFERAAMELRLIATSPTLSRADLVEALRYLVPLEQTLGRTAEAEEAARTLVALAPDATLPEGAPESAVTRLEELHAEVRPAELALTLTETRATLSMAPALSMLPTLRLTCAGNALTTAEGPSATELVLALDPQLVALCEASALTAFGAPILSTHGERPVEVELELEVQALPVPAPTPDDDAWPWILAGTSGALALVAVAVAVGIVATNSPPALSLPAPGVVTW